MNYVKDKEIKEIIRQALKEDIGRKDITTELIIPKNTIVNAILLAKENCVVCGLGIAVLVFKTQDARIKFKPQVKDGAAVKKGKVLARISGRAASILTAERVGLNFLTLLSGIATKTKEFVEAVKPYKTKIMDTRKTIPGLRCLQKYAVRTGGGYNHRMNLDEMVLIKDNHLKVIRNYRNLPIFTYSYRVELEVKDLPEFQQALRLKPDIIMLDNMQIRDIRKAVILREKSRARPKIEVSGKVNLNNVRQIAKTGVDLISVGALTHSLKAIDISLEIL